MLRSSDSRAHPWRYHWYGTLKGMIVWRLRNTPGHIFSRILRFAQQKGLINRESFITQFISLALFTVGATNSLGNDDLLAAFAAGLLIFHNDTVLPLTLVYRLCDLLGRPFQATDRK